jgi:hypothetical protein
MTQKILLEAFGSIVNEDLRSEGVSLEDVLSAGLDELEAAINMSDVETIVTGMNGDVTHALQDAVEARDMDVDVDAFYPNVSNIADEDDIEYNEAWKKGFTWRNNKLFVADEDSDTETVDMTVRFGDAGNNGEALLQHSRRKSVPALDINLDRLVNRDAAYGGGDEAASAEAEA